MKNEKGGMMQSKYYRDRMAKLTGKTNHTPKFKRKTTTACGAAWTAEGNAFQIKNMFKFKNFLKDSNYPRVKKYDDFNKRMAMYVII